MTPKKKIKNSVLPWWDKIQNALLPIGILLVAAFLRLYRISDYMTFLGDEGRDVLVVKHLLEGDLVGLGPTASVGGFFLGPAYYYFMAPFLWLFQYDPTGPAVMVALFGVVTVFLIYHVGSEFFGKYAGALAALLYAFSPLVISYSRSSWNPNLMPFFSLFALYILYKALEKNSWKYLVFSGALLGIAIQLHYLALFLLAIVFIYTLFVHFTKTHLTHAGFFFHFLMRLIKDYVSLFLGFVLGSSPFLAFETIHGFPNTQSIARFIFQSGDTGGSDQFFAIIYNVYFRLFARLITKFPPLEQVSLQANPDIAVWYYVTLLLGVASVCAVGYKWVASFKKTPSDFRRFTLVMLWLSVGIALFGFYKKPIYDYYFGFMFPLPFFLVGNFLATVYKSPQLRMIGKLISIGIFLWILMLNAQGVPFRSPPNRQLDQVKKISAFILEKAGGEPFNFALVASGNSDHAYRYFFELWGNTPITIANPQVDPQREAVTRQLFVICESLPCHLLGHSLWEISGFGQATISAEWNVSVVKVYKLEHYK